MISICITHREPLLPRSWYNVELALGDYLADSPSHISNIDTYWHLNRNLSYGAAGSYSVPKLVEKMGVSQDPIIRLTSFRKAVVRDPQLVARIEPGMGVMTPRAAGSTDLANLSPRPGLEFLVARPKPLARGVLGQYIGAHNATDIINYLSLASDMNILDGKSINRFLTNRYIIQGGAELGVFPTGWVCDVLEEMSRLGSAFLDAYRNRIIDYDAYQVRAVGFLSERLTSFLLLKKLKEIYPGGIPSGIFGELVVISEDGSYDTGKA